MARQKGPGRPPRPPDAFSSPTLILDNGAHSIKAGFSLPGTTPTPDQCHVIPNCIARSQRDKLSYIGAELDKCADFGELQVRRPVERGYIVNWEGEKAVWERTFFDNASPVRCEPRSTNCILTEAPNAPAALQRNADEIVFEEFEFSGLFRTTSAALNAYAPPSPLTSGHASSKVPPECLLVLDVGYSHTTVTPLYHGRPLHSACRRLEIGGKVLTNHLKDLLSRTMNVQREDWIVQEIKEDVCFVATDSSEFNSKLERVWKGGQHDPREIDASIVVDYVLPDYEQLKRGFARPHDPSRGARMRRLGMTGSTEMVLPVGNERFTVPELLFTPSDLGMQQAGVAGVVMQSLDALPPGLRQPLLSNVLVVGGTSRLPGFTERLEHDLRALYDDSFAVRIVHADDPVKNAWLGGAQIAQDVDLLRDLIVTRQEYSENGDAWTRRKFAGKVGR